MERPRALRARGFACLRAQKGQKFVPLRYLLTIHALTSPGILYIITRGALERGIQTINVTFR